MLKNVRGCGIILVNGKVFQGYAVKRYNSNCFKHCEVRMQKTSIRFFEDIPVRAVWDEKAPNGGFVLWI